LIAPDSFCKTWSTGDDRDRQEAFFRFPDARVVGVIDPVWVPDTSVLRPANERPSAADGLLNRAVQGADTTIDPGNRS